jgi:hypothetical protein
MNRKQRRKTKQIVEDEYTQSTKSIIIALVVVLVVFALFYVLTVFINDSSRKLNTKEPEVVEPEIQYLEILGDNTFTMSPREYYVLFYDFDGPEAAYYDYLVDKYASVENQYIYKVDLGNGFNTKFIAEKTNKKAKKAGDLKVKDATLIKIRKGKNVEYIEGSSQVIAGKLIK